MINTESIGAFLESLSIPPSEVTKMLYITMRTSDENEIETIKLAHRGYLGCVAFAGAGNDQIILRLLPERSLANSPVAVAWSFVTEGMTIAPDLERFVAGRLAQMDAANPDNSWSQEMQHDLLQFASEFGDITSTENALKSLDDSRSIEGVLPRQGKLWAAACPDNPWCKALAAAWSLRGQAASNWAKNAIREIPEITIAWCIYLASQLRDAADTDVTEAAWRLIRDDDVFDSTYTGYTRGTSTADWENEPLVQAVHWLQRQGYHELTGSQTDLWEAAQVYAEDPLNYDGAQHLAAAKKIASADPILAYIQAANAAAFFARATQQKPVEAIVFAHNLAVENGWENLREVLNWAQTYIDLDI